MNKTRVSPPVGRRSRPRSRSGASTAAGDDPMRATAASAAGPSHGGGVVVQSIRPKLVSVHISPLRFDVCNTTQKERKKFVPTMSSDHESD